MAELVTLSEAARLLSGRLGRAVTRQEVRWLIGRHCQAVRIHRDAVAVEVTRLTLADGIDAGDLVELERAMRELTVGG